jgi:hypothetical protein
MRNLPNGVTGIAGGEGGGDAVCVIGSGVVVALNYGRV